MYKVVSSCGTIEKNYFSVLDAYNAAVPPEALDPEPQNDWCVRTLMHTIRLLETSNKVDVCTREHDKLSFFIVKNTFPNF